MTTNSVGLRSQRRTEPTATPITLGAYMRWSGFVTIVLGIMVALETLLHPVRDAFNARAMIQQTVLGVPWSLVHTFAVISFILGPFATLGLYLRQRTRLSGLGVWGAVVSTVGWGLGIGVVTPDAYIFPILARADATASLLTVPGPLIPGGEFGIYLILSGLILIAGILMLGVASLRTRTFSTWAWLLVIIGMPLVSFGPIVSNTSGLVGAVMAGVGYVWLGVELWRTRDADLA